MNVKSTKRKLIALFETEEGSNTELFYKVVQRFMAYNIDSFLRKANNKLSYTLGAELPGLSVLRTPENNVKSIDKNDKIIRFMLHDLTEIKVNHNITDNNSHIVEISVGETHDKKNKNDMFEFKVTISSIEELCSIIEDVMLDIQMFYHFGLNKDFKNVEERKNFSLLKVDFCKEKMCDFEIQKRYYSLATFCKNGSNELDYKNYAELWEAFYKKINGNVYSTEYMTEDYLNKIVDDIINKHPYGNQISRRKLCKIIFNLKKGRYILACLISRPHNKKTLRIISPLFKGTKLRRGSIMIVPYESRIKYCRQNRYIHVYEFVVGGNNG